MILIVKIKLHKRKCRLNPIDKNSKIQDSIGYLECSLGALIQDLLKKIYLQMKVALVIVHEKD